MSFILNVLLAVNLTCFPKFLNVHAVECSHLAIEFYAMETVRFFRIGHLNWTRLE